MLLIVAEFLRGYMLRLFIAIKVRLVTLRDKLREPESNRLAGISVFGFY